MSNTDINEKTFLQLFKTGGFYIKIGRRYRPISNERDSGENLVDLGYTLYHKNHDGKYEMVMLGQKGDVQLPAGMQDPGLSVEERYEESGEKFQVGILKVEKAIAPTAGCLFKGCVSFIYALFVFYLALGADGSDPVSLVAWLVIAAVGYLIFSWVRK